MRNENQTTGREAFLKGLSDAEDLGEKKMKIYSRLLTDAALAEDMETLALRHEKRKKTLQQLFTGKPLKSKNDGGRCETNDEEEEE